MEVLQHLGAVYNPINIGKAPKNWLGWADPGDEYGAKIADIANAILGV